MREPFTQQPIFIHAFWRTGSTYLWSKFREQSRYRAYYEPLHEVYIDASVQKLEAAWSNEMPVIMRHPRLGTSYFAEYEGFIGAGSSHFEKGLPYQRYCLEEAEPDEPLRNYIADLLIFALANGQTPVLQFNRSLLRTGWLTAHFNPVNILLLRRPIDTWKSFISFEHHYFPTVLCMIAGQNQHRPILQGVVRRHGVPFFVGETFQSDYDFYHEYAVRNLANLYPLFYEVHLLTSIAAARHADCIIDLTEISENASSREKLTKWLRRLGMDISLDDCHLPSCPDLSSVAPDWLAFEESGRDLLKQNATQLPRIPRNRFESQREFIGVYFQDVLSEFVGDVESGLGTVRRPQGEERQAAGRLHFERGSVQEASALFRDAILERPNAERWNDWATAQMACQHPLLAELGYQRALELGDPVGLAAHNLGAVLFQAGRHHQAIPVLKRVLRSSNRPEEQLLSGKLAMSQCRTLGKLKVLSEPTNGFIGAQYCPEQPVEKTDHKEIQPMSESQLKHLQQPSFAATLASPCAVTVPSAPKSGGGSDQAVVLETLILHANAITTGLQRILALEAQLKAQNVNPPQAHPASHPTSLPRVVSADNMTRVCAIYPDRIELGHCHFYHSMKFPDGSSVYGEWDIQDRFDDYIGNVDVRGKTLLDVGTASGLIAFETERRGATVTAFDLDSGASTRYLPYKSNLYYTDHRAWVKQLDAGWRTTLVNGFWYAHRRFRSRVEVVYGNLFELAETLSPVDVVVAGAVLEHISDPVSAIGVLSQLAKETIVVAFTPLLDSEELLMKSATALNDPRQEYTWFTLSKGLLQRILENVGFRIQKVVWSRQYARYRDAWEERPTIVARRM